MSLEEEDAEENHSIPANPVNPNPIITINCGGTKFQTFRETLINNSEYFRAMFAGGFAEGSHPPRDEYFLDMNPKIFGLLLDRMRYGIACKLPTIGEQRPSGLVFAAEFLGVEYRNADEIERDQQEQRKQQKALEAAQKDLDRQARLASLKEAGLVDFLVMCVDMVQRKCLARVIDVDDKTQQFLIHYEHWADRFNEWVPKGSSRISRTLGRCDCRNTSCPDSGHLGGGAYSIVVCNNPTGIGTTTTTIPTSQSYFINYLNGAATSIRNTF